MNSKQKTIANKLTSFVKSKLSPSIDKVPSIEKIKAFNYERFPMTRSDDPHRKNIYRIYKGGKPFKTLYLNDNEYECMNNPNRVEGILKYFNKKGSKNPDFSKYLHFLLAKRNLVLVGSGTKRRAESKEFMIVRADGDEETQYEADSTPKTDEASDSEHSDSNPPKSPIVERKEGEINSETPNADLKQKVEDRKRIIEESTSELEQAKREGDDSKSERLESRIKHQNMMISWERIDLLNKEIEDCKNEMEDDKTDPDVRDELKELISDKIAERDTMLKALKNKVGAKASSKELQHESKPPLASSKEEASSKAEAKTEAKATSAPARPKAVDYSEFENELKEMALSAGNKLNLTPEEHVEMISKRIKDFVGIDDNRKRMVVAYGEKWMDENPKAIKTGKPGNVRFMIGDYRIYIYPDKPLKEFIAVKNLKDKQAIYAMMKSKNKNAKPINTTDSNIAVPFDPKRIIEDIEKYMNTKMNMDLGSKFEFNEADRSTIISVIERAIHRIKIKNDVDVRMHAGSSEVQTFTTHGMPNTESKPLKSERLKTKDLLARMAALKLKIACK